MPLAWRSISTSSSGTTSTNTNNTYYYTLGGKLLSDTLGSVVASVSNTAGTATVLGNQAYGPYGNQRYVKGTIGTDKGYTGQYNDSLTGLDYYNARYYDPVVGRFLSADTEQGNGQGMDPYAYVGGNPETDTDPTGQQNITMYSGGGNFADFGGNGAGFDPITPLVVGIAAVAGAFLGWVSNQWNTNSGYHSSTSTGWTGDTGWNGTLPHAINSLTWETYRLEHPRTTGGGGGTTTTGGGSTTWTTPWVQPWTMPWTRPWVQPWTRFHTQSSVKRTPKDIYRGGGKDDPEVVKKLRIEGINGRGAGDSDIHPDENNMVCPNKGGVSTNEKINPNYKAKRWWKLPEGTELPEGLQVRNDHGDHWLIELSEPMPVDNYVQLLQNIDGWC